MSELVTPQTRPEPKRDRYGRYLLPHPQSGKEEAWTRATTFAKTISDMYGLGQWQQRMVAKGIATRPDLYALAASTPIDDKAKFDRITNDAKEAAAASSGANLGTALHAFTEQVDAGQDPTVPEPWAADINAYRKAITDAKITVHPEWIERVVVFPELKVAGTLDRILTLRDGRTVIGDVKTGKDLGYSWGEIAIQLALYANSSHIWDRHRERYARMPKVDQSVGIVIHLPVGKAQCDLYQVDISDGLRGAGLCHKVREWRTGARKLATAYSLDHTATVLDQIRLAPDRAGLEAVWRAAKDAGEWTSDHTKAAEQRLAEISAGPAGGPQEKEEAAA